MSEPISSGLTPAPGDGRGLRRRTSRPGSRHPAVAPFIERIVSLAVGSGVGASVSPQTIASISATWPDGHSVLYQVDGGISRTAEAWRLSTSKTLDGHGQSGQAAAPARPARGDRPAPQRFSNARSRSFATTVFSSAVASARSQPKPEHAPRADLAATKGCELIRRVARAYVVLRAWPERSPIAFR